MSSEDPKIVARDERKRPEVEKLLRQFIGDGAKGNTPAYKRGHEFAFGKDAAFKARVLALMETHGMTFDEAFQVIEGEDSDD